ncbi:unnamed protein product [Cuscuta campestris]|uniref:Uncharacterized protein n=1 Tax=Cuscuta campestris TaxID=132261 RepID=A0A484NAW7_9ASTE|nr:unnamed protein product [Cuscuta campestris]
MDLSFLCRAEMRTEEEKQQRPPPPAQPQQVVKKSKRGPRSRSSQYRGVTFYRRTDSKIRPMNCRNYQS